MRRAAAFTLLALLVAAPAHAQLAFELEAGGGYTLVDVEGIAVADGAVAQDWSQPSYRFAGRMLFGGGSGPRFGVEVGHQHLYWYSVRIPYGNTPIYREYDVSATVGMALVRLGSVDLGAGLAALDDPVPLASVAVGFEVVPRFRVKLRADGILADEPTIPVGLGFSYAFGAR